MSAATLIRLRPYQREAIDAVYEAWNDGIQRPAVVLPTGAGKTLIFSHLISEFIEKTGERVTVLVNRDELCDQALEELRDAAPHLTLGKVKAADNQVDAQVTVCSVQTLARGTRLGQLGDIGMVIVDEVHFFAAPTYKKVLLGLGCFSPESGTRMVGFTATMSRTDGGLDEIVDEVVYSKSLMWMISKGYLVPPKGKLIAAPDLDLKGVKSSAGDYQSGDLGRALTDSGLVGMLPGAYKEHAGNRQGVVFVPTVALAEEIADAFTAAGIPAAMVCGSTPIPERQRIFADYRRGRIQVMTNAMVLTVGFNMPQASVAVIARPTQSQALYQQIVGRVLRLFPGKTDALILDVVGSSVDNKLKTLIDLEPGMFKDPKPCMECECIPCACPCDGCGEIKTKCTCPKEERKDPALLSAGGSVDLFSGSSQSWLTTEKGVMFIPDGKNGQVFLWESQANPGTWNVMYWAKGVQRPEVLHQELPMGTAMAWAETEVDDRADFSVRKTASWRKTRPSDVQLSLARSLKIEFHEDIRKGDLGNLISVKFASRRLDPNLRK